MNYPTVTPLPCVNRTKKAASRISRFRLSLIKLGMLGELHATGKRTSDNPIVLAVATRLASSDNPSLLAASLAAYRAARAGGKASTVVGGAVGNAVANGGVDDTLPDDAMAVATLPLPRRRRRQVSTVKSVSW